MNDSEYGARWRTLAAQLQELERNAGIADAAASLRNTTPLRSDHARELEGDRTGGVPPESRSPSPPDAAQRRELRALYFSVAHPTLRKGLIAKQRELELFERTAARTRLGDVQQHLESIRRRPSEGWWIAAIVGATLVIVGYVLFGLAGAIAAGVAALFVGNGIEQSARRRFEHAVAFAEEDVSAAAADATITEQSRDLFSERESATGYADPALDDAR